MRCHVTFEGMHLPFFVGRKSTLKQRADIVRGGDVSSSEYQFDMHIVVASTRYDRRYYHLVSFDRHINATSSCKLYPTLTKILDGGTKDEMRISKEALFNGTLAQN